MSLAHAILGMVRNRPLTGYDLKTQCFDQSIAHFWPADQSQIYRTLDRMVAEGWIVGELVVQESRPNRTVYRLTASGASELARWLRTEQALPAVRDPFLIQLFFAASLANETVDTLLEGQGQLHAARLARYDAIPLPPLEELGGDRELVFQRLTLEWGIALERAYLDWCERARGVIRSLPGDTTS